MKDVTSTSFGLLIAFLLPGLVGLYGLSPFSLALQSMFATFLQASSNVGLFLLVTLASLAVGLLITALRYVTFEQLICRGSDLTQTDFAALRTEGHLAAFRANVDETYRYHQFFGGMAIVMPILFVKWIWDQPAGDGNWWILLVVFAVLETVTVIVARSTFIRYVSRAKAILKEASDG